MFNNYVYIQTEKFILHVLLFLLDYGVWGGGGQGKSWFYLAVLLL